MIKLKNVSTLFKIKHSSLPCLILQKNDGNDLDKKQTASYDIICYSFIVKDINKYNLLEGENAEEV